MTVGVLAFRIDNATERPSGDVVQAESSLTFDGKRFGKEVLLVVCISGEISMFSIP